SVMRKRNGAPRAPGAVGHTHFSRNCSKIGCIVSSSGNISLLSLLRRLRLLRPRLNGRYDPIDAIDPIDAMDPTSATSDARPAAEVPASARFQLLQSTLRPGSTPDTPCTPDRCTCADQSRGDVKAPRPHTQR